MWFTGEDDYEKGIEKLKKDYNIPLILFSIGRDGSRAYYDDTVTEAPAFIQENTVDTTGAGDTFMGCCINYILENGIENLTKENLCEMLSFANAAASIITTRKGALKAMPDISEIKMLYSNC